MQAARSANSIRFIEVNNYDSSPHPLASFTLLQAATKVHSGSSDRRVIAMNISKLAAQSSIVTSSSLTRPPSNDTTNPKDAASLIGSARGSRWRRSRLNAVRSSWRRWQVDIDYGGSPSFVEGCRQSWSTECDNCVVIP
jgi:hypothetical protein